MTSSEFLLCMQKAITPLPKCMQNPIPTKNIQGVKKINTFPTHPIGKQGKTFVCRSVWHFLDKKSNKAAHSAEQRAEV